MYAPIKYLIIHFPEYVETYGLYKDLARQLITSSYSLFI
jgi:hypothetical protein